MEALVANLAMVARRDMAGLRKVCGVDDEDIADMIAEIKRLDPKPGRAFGSSAIQPVIPDVNVRLAPDGSWMIELNTDVLPRLLVNQTYAARISRHKGSEADRSFVSGCLQTANWLTKSLEQRARTILKVSSEIVRQQDAFFAYGVEHLRPLNLKAIAEATGMHEFDGVASYLQQIHVEPPRPVRAEIFLHRLDRIERWRRFAFGRIGALPDQANDRTGERQRNFVGRRHRRAPERLECRHRPAHGRKIPRKHAHSIFGGTAPAKGRALKCLSLRALIALGNHKHVPRKSKAFSIEDMA